MSSTDLKSKILAPAGALLQLVRRPPWLGTALALAGGIVCMILALRGLGELGSPASRAIHLAIARQDGDVVNRLYAFFQPRWIQIGWVMLPVLVVALLRLRRGELVLPVFLACLWCLVLWLAQDLSVNWTRIHVDPLGMRPSVPAYSVKLLLTSFLIMSPPLLLWLYWRSTTLDRYVVRGFTTPLLLTFFGLSGIWITMDLLNNASSFVSAKFDFVDVGFYYLRQMPQVIVMIAEAVLLLASLYALSRLSRYNELISMLGAGRSVLRILTPLLVLGLWVSLAVLALNYQLAPEAQRKTQEMLADAEELATGKKNLASAEPNVAYRNTEDRRTWLIHQLPYDLSNDNKMTDVTVIHDGPDGRPKTIWLARKAMWDAINTTWRFYDVTVLTASSGRMFTKENLEKLDVEETWKETPGLMLSDKLNADYLGVQDLVSYLRSNESLPDRSLARYRSTLHSRFATPFRCFLMVLLAAPLAMVSSRRGVLGGISAAVGMFVLVYFLSVSMQKLAEGSYLSPAMGSWTVPLLAAAAGSWILWMRTANRELPSLNPLRWLRRP